jgi:hypothetical protein
MTSEEKRWMDQLCRLIHAERDSYKFSALVRELDAFLEKRETRLKERWTKDPMELNRDADDDKENV